MKTIRPRPHVGELSLVPLADMLTNTVGIVLFILIFTVLTAGGVVVAKRLPMERTTAKKPLLVVCADHRVYPRADDLVDRFLDPLGKPGGTRAGINRWLESFKSRTLEDKHFALTGDVSDGLLGASVALVCTPRTDGGERSAAARLPDSDFQKMLAEHSADDWFLFFLVRPDGLDAFFAARDIAAKSGYSVGWDPLGPTDPLRLSLTGNGRAPGEQ